MAALYLLINVGVVGIPFVFSWHPRLRFVDRWQDFAVSCLVVALGFLAWDVVFTAMGVWGFDDLYLLGSRIAGLPIEEWLFFLCIPYACVFTYHSLNVMGVGHLSERAALMLTATILALTIVLAAAFWSSAYTFVTSTLLAVFLAVLLVMRPAWLGRLWISYFVLLVPFVITNGLLTGIDFWSYPVLNSAPELIRDHVVWYNNAENMGLRFFSIPLDDFLYAFLLTGLNVTGFEYWGSRRRKITKTQ